MSFKFGVALACLLNLAAGIAIGVSVDRTFAHARAPLGPPGEPPNLAKLLELSPEQDVKVREVLDRHRPEFEKARGEELKRLSAALDGVDAELKGILTPEQFAKLIERRKQMEERFKGGPPFPPRDR